MLIFVVACCGAEDDAGQVMQRHAQIAPYDTVPPMVSSYRAVLLRDGRIAVQLQAGDLHSGVSETGVATRYSVDDGRTWQHQVHSSVEDDFGRPALFETVLGPFSRGTNLLIAVSARDGAGNVTARLPVDASVLLASPNAEHILDHFGVLSPSGNPVFAPAAVARRVAWVAAAESALAHLLGRQVQEDLSATDRFELRRLQELRVIPAAFDRWDVDVLAFTRVEVPLVQASAPDESELTLLRVGTWTR